MSKGQFKEVYLKNKLNLFLLHQGQLQFKIPRFIIKCINGVVVAKAKHNHYAIILIKVLILSLSSLQLKSQLDRLNYADVN